MWQARAAHIAGVGAHGSGFLTNPRDVVAKLAAAGVTIVSTAAACGAELLRADFKSVGTSVAEPTAAVRSQPRTDPASPSTSPVNVLPCELTAQLPGEPTPSSLKEP